MMSRFLSKSSDIAYIFLLTTIMVTFGSFSSLACPPISQQCLDALTELESAGSGTYLAVNPTSGTIGRYQFIESSLIQAGFYQGAGDGTNHDCGKQSGPPCDFTGSWSLIAQSYGVNSREDFLNNQAAQDAAYAQYQVNNYNAMGDLQNLIGTEVNGKLVTCESLILGSHLGGPGGLKAYLERGENWGDGGSTVSVYFETGSDCSQGLGTPPAEAFESCDQEILTTGAQLGQMRMQVEKQQIDEAITKPISVMELTCFDQFGEIFNNEIGSIFGNTEDDDDIVPGVGLERGDDNSFSDIFADAQDQIGKEILYAVSGGLVGTRGNTINSMISSQVQNALSSVFGGLGGAGGNVQFQCEAMNLLWKLMQCEDIFDFKIPTLEDLIGDFSLRDKITEMLPDSCTGQILGNYALDNVSRIFAPSPDDAPPRP